MVKNTIIYFFYISCSFTLVVCWEKYISPNLTNSQEPEPERQGAACFWLLGAGAGAACKKLKSRSRSRLKKKKRGARAGKNQPAPQPSLVQMKSSNHSWLRFFFLIFQSQNKIYSVIAKFDSLNFFPNQMFLLNFWFFFFILAHQNVHRKDRFPIRICTYNNQLKYFQIFSHFGLIYSPFKAVFSSRNTQGSHFYPFSSIKNLVLKKSVLIFLLPIRIGKMNNLK